MSSQWKRMVTVPLRSSSELAHHERRPRVLLAQHKLVRTEGGGRREKERERESGCVGVRCNRLPGWKRWLGVVHEVHALAERGEEGHVGRGVEGGLLLEAELRVEVADRREVEAAPLTVDLADQPVVGHTRSVGVVRVCACVCVARKRAEGMRTR